MHPTILSRVVLLVLIAQFGTSATSHAQTNNYFTDVGGSSIGGSFWSTNPNGPYTDPLNTTGGAIINFGQTNLTVTGASIAVANINATANTTFTTFGGTISNFGNGIVTIDVAPGITLNFGTQAFTAATTAGYIKNGSGVVALSGGTYQGGFTLNAGTVVLNGVNGMGGGAANTLTINGGTIAASANRDLSGKYGGGITVGGDFTFGSSVPPASAAANLAFTNAVGLGSATRAITIGGTGTYTLGGVISGAPGTGLTVNATAAGTIALTGTSSNTYTGLTTVNNGTLRLAKTLLANAIGGDLSITGGGVTFLAGTQNQILDTASVTVTGGTFNGTGANTSAVMVLETIGSLSLSGGGIFNGGASSVWTIAGTASFTGGAGTLFVGNSGSTYASHSLSLTGMTATAGSTVATANSFTIYGNNASTVGTWTVGAGGLFLDGSRLNLRTGSTGNQGSRLVLDGNVTVQGTTPSFISVDNQSGSDGLSDVELSSTTDAVSRTFTVGGGGANLTVSAPITDGASTAGGVTKAGPGLLTLSGTNAYTGPTTLSAGTLSVATTANLGDAAADLVFDGGTLQITGTALNNFSGIGHSVVFNTNKSVGLDIVASGNTFTADQALNLGTGGFSKLGAGAVVLSLANTYSGETTLSAGTLSVTGSIDNTSGVTVNGGNLSVTGSVTTTGGVTLNAGSVSVAGNVNTATGVVINAGTFTVTGVVNNAAGGMTARGGSTLTLNNASGALNDASSVTLGGPGHGGATLVVSAAEAVGTFNIAQGYNLITPTAALTVASFGTRAVGGTANLTTVANPITFTTPPTLTNGILPFMTTLLAADTGNPGNWATIDGTNAVVAYTGYQNVSRTVPNLSTWTSTNNINIQVNSAGAINLDTSRTVNSLRSFTASNTLTINLGANDLTIGGGILIGNGGTGMGFTGTTGAIKSTTDELIVYATHTTASVTNPWAAKVDLGADGVLTKGGLGFLTLSNSGNVIKDVYVNAGTLISTASDSLGGSGTVYIFGSSTILRFDALTANQNQTAKSFVVGGAGATISTGLVTASTTSTLGGNPGTTGTLNGTLTLRPTSANNTTRGTIALMGDIGGSGSISVPAVSANTLGRVTLGGNNTFAGGVAITGGTTAAATSNFVLTLDSDTALGTGALTIAGLADSNTITSSAIRTIANAINANSNFIVDGSDGITFTGPMSLSNNRIITTTNTGGTTISGPISGSSTFNKAGSEPLHLSGVNMYTGATTVSNGTLLLGSNAPVNYAGSLGVSSTDVLLGVSGGTSPVALLTNAAVRIGRGVSVVATTDGTSTLGGNAAVNSIFGGTVTLAKDAILSQAVGGNVTFSGRITGGFGIAVGSAGNAGTVELTAANNDYSGGTTVAFGTLLVNNAAGSATGTGPVSVNAGAALGGRGRIAPTTLAVAGNLAPGDDGAGILTVAAALGISFSSGATLTTVLTGDVPGNGPGAYSQLVIESGTSIDLDGATLQGSLAGYTPSGSARFFIINNQNESGGLVNTFTNGSTVTIDAYQFAISYTGDIATGSLSGGNDVVLYNAAVIPEPTTVGLLASAGLVVVGMVRRRRGSRARQ